MLDQPSTSAAASPVPPFNARSMTDASSTGSFNEDDSNRRYHSHQHQSSTEHISIDSGKTALTPISRCTYEIPNDNENDGQYATEFWLNALVPKPHTNFFGYESSIGPICISISTRESHECYKALVRTPFKFGVVYVPTSVINGSIYGTDLDRLTNPTPQKILLYHALWLYFQQAEKERCGYLLTALHNQRLSAENSARVVSSMLAQSADALWGRSVAEATKEVTPTKETVSRKQTRKRGLQRSNTKRSIELRRAEISDFMDSLFQSTAGTDAAPSPSAISRRPTSVGGESYSYSLDEDAMLTEIDVFLAAEREARDLAVATESLTEIRDDHLKPLLRNLEPKIYRRRLRIDFVVVGASDHSRLVDMTAPHRRFLRTLERASARMRGDPNSACDSPHHSANSTPERHRGGPGTGQASTKNEARSGKQRDKRQKTQEEMDVKRNNVIQELIETERSYVEKLRALIDIYVVPLRSAARSTNNALIPAYDAHVIFGNIERVSEVNERFLGDLEAWQQGEMDPKETIGSLCRDHFVDFHVYKRYINGYQHALVSSRELEAKNPLYAAFLQRAREREECKKLGISDLLIMPVQRIPRYTLLLTDLLKVIPEDDSDVPRIRLALERVNEIGQLADNQVAETVAELHHIHTTIEGCPPNLISASREFIGAIDVSEIDLVTGAPKKPMCLLVFSDLLMIVERFWPPKGHGGIRVTGNSSSRQSCPIHALSVDAPRPATGSSSTISGGAANLSSASTPSIAAATGAASASTSTSAASTPLPSTQQLRQQICTCSSNYASSSSVANAFLSTTSGSANSRKKWGRFAGWIDVTRVSILEKNASPSSRSFYIHRYPENIEDKDQLVADTNTSHRQRTTTTSTLSTSVAAAVAAASASTAPTANPVGMRSSGSSIISLDSNNTASPIPSTSSTAAAVQQSSERLHQKFARILYPSETTYESYGDHGYWYPQSLHEFEADHPLSRDAFFEFLNTAWDRTVARCFESSGSELSRHASSSSNNNTAGIGHRKTKSGIELPNAVINLGHPELDRVDVGSQSWTVRIWDAADYARSRPNCPSALMADMTVVWDYRQMGSPSTSTAMSSSSNQAAKEVSSDISYYPLQACRIVGFDGDYFHITSTSLPLATTQHTANDPPDTYAELIEEKDVADNWPALCRLVEKAVIMYQYVLLAYPEHRRVQQCYNRSILASLFGQNALGSSSAVKVETVSAAPRKLFSRAKHLFSSGRLRGSGSQKDSADTSNLFSSAYNNAVAADTIGPSSGSSPYNHSTISTPHTVLGKYKLKTKSSTMVSSRRMNTMQQDKSSQSPAKSASSAMTTPSRSATAHSTLYGQPSLGFTASASGNAAIFELGSSSSSKLELKNTSIRDEASMQQQGTKSRFQAARKISHTMDEFPLFPSVQADDSIDIRTRSHTSWDQRNNSSSSISSLHASPTKQKAHTLVQSASTDTMLGQADSLISGSSSLHLANSDEQFADDAKARATDPQSDTFVKRRSMSVVSAGSFGKAKPSSAFFGANFGSTGSKKSRHADKLFASTASMGSRPASSAALSGTGVRRQREDGDDGDGRDSASEFSLQLDLKHHGERLDIPRDLKLEFDEALSAADATPPVSTHELSLDIQSFASQITDSICTTHVGSSNASIGLNVLIPTNDRGIQAKTTWDSKSPDYDTASQQLQLPLSSADSLNSCLSSPSALSSTKGASGRGSNRRQGVYGVPPKSPVSTSILSPFPQAEEAKPHSIRSRPDILLDIARELGEDEPFENTMPTSPLFVDDDEITRHFGQMSMLSQSQISPMGPTFDKMFASHRDAEDGNPLSAQLESPRPLPPLPAHSKSLNYGSERNALPAMISTRPGLVSSRTIAHTGYNPNMDQAFDTH
ncbi:hypothetical protein EDC05_005677 [Coemansia umbellata]|uniref:DH domain-containing protein n=1 Tax=Coemansia umbellata TaxID=1424467 RepID=A0ABQ8PEW2_9FUNG|nr:hypothetical protein EDC05_005677 [Coemansia umbellata]